MMSLFSSQKTEPELALLFDIGSASVGGALFEVQNSGAPKIVFSAREPVVLKEKIDTDLFLLLVLKSLETVVSRVCLSGFRKPGKIFCVLSSPWYVSQTRIIKLEKNTPFLFTAKLADELIQKEVGFFEEENSAKFADTDGKLQLIEFENMRTSLNGYVILDPLNKKAKKLQMAVFISMSGDKILEKITGTISRHFRTADVKFSSFAMASFMVTRDILPQQDDFLLVDIAGEVTDISLVRKNVLCNSVSYPLGYNFMVRSVASSLGCTLSEAGSFISLYKDRHAGKSIEGKLESIMDELKTKWLKGFQESLVDLSSDISLPATVFATVDYSLADFFSNIIQTEQSNLYALTESKFKVILLDAGALHGLASFGDKVARDPFILLESIYINRFIC